LEECEAIFRGCLQIDCQIYEASTEGMFMPERGDAYLSSRVCR